MKLRNGKVADTASKPAASPKANPTKRKAPKPKTTRNNQKPTSRVEKRESKAKNSEKDGATKQTQRLKLNGPKPPPEAINFRMRPYYTPVRVSDRPAEVQNQKIREWRDHVMLPLGKPFWRKSKKGELQLILPMLADQAELQEHEFRKKEGGMMGQLMDFMDREEDEEEKRRRKGKGKENVREGGDEDRGGDGNGGGRRDGGDNDDNGNGGPGDKGNPIIIPPNPSDPGPQDEDPGGE
ncbi:MAG: hypothetical protein Q9166_002422 [cf. Caloplaca sp. 2 TL-2023]